MSALTVVIPVWNEAAHLPALFRALERQRGIVLDLIFIDNASTDGSGRLLRAWRTRSSAIRSVKVLTEKKRGFAHPLNRGLKAARGEFVAVLDADTAPAPEWAKKLAAALAGGADLVVGATDSLLSAHPTVWERTADTLFSDFSRKSARAEQNALPWGPTCNLGLKRAWYRKTGPFAPSAGPALDIDWCWRAQFQGARLEYCSGARIAHRRRNQRDAFLRQMHRYGLTDGWIVRRFSRPLGLVESAAKRQPLEFALSAYQRIMSVRMPRALHNARAEAAAALACGVYSSHASSMRIPALPAVRRPIGWDWDNKLSRLWVPGRGLTDLTGPARWIWREHARGAGAHEIAHKLAHKEHIPESLAEKTVKQFFREVRLG